MRIKTFLIFLLSGAVLFFCLIYLGGNQRPTIQSIVTETHKQFHNWKNFQDNLRDAEEKRFQAEDEHLQLLGFTENPRLYPKNVWTNTSLPVVLTVLFKGQEDMVRVCTSKAIRRSDAGILQVWLDLYIFSGHRVRQKHGPHGSRSFCPPLRCGVVFVRAADGWRLLQYIEMSGGSVRSRAVPQPCPGKDLYGKEPMR